MEAPIINTSIQACSNPSPASRRQPPHAGAHLGQPLQIQPQRPLTPPLACSPPLVGPTPSVPPRRRAQGGHRPRTHLHSNCFAGLSDFILKLLQLVQPAFQKLYNIYIYWKIQFHNRFKVS
jgi:hypothetical protein